MCEQVGRQFEALVMGFSWCWFEGSNGHTCALSADPAVSPYRCELVVTAPVSKLESSWVILHFCAVMRLLLLSRGFTMLWNGDRIQVLQTCTATGHDGPMWVRTMCCASPTAWLV